MDSLKTSARKAGIPETGVPCIKSRVSLQLINNIEKSDIIKDFLEQEKDKSESPAYK